MQAKKFAQSASMSHNGSQQLDENTEGSARLVTRSTLRRVACVRTEYAGVHSRADHVDSSELHTSKLMNKTCSNETLLNKTLLNKTLMNKSLERDS